MSPTTPPPDSIPPDWTSPNAEGLSCMRPGNPKRATLRDRRHWRCMRPVSPQIDAWPGEWRAMVAGWVAKRSDAPVRRDALLKSAGAARAHDMDRVIGLLLRARQIETEERFERGSWWLHAVRFTGASALRAALGLPEPDRARQDWASHGPAPAFDRHSGDPHGFGDTIECHDRLTNEMTSW